METDQKEDLIMRETQAFLFKYRYEISIIFACALAAGIYIWGFNDGVARASSTVQWMKEACLCPLK